MKIPPEVRAPAVTAYPVTAPDRARQPSLGVVAKRTYIAIDDGSCIPAPDQTALHFEPVDGDDDDQLLIADTEFWLDKPETDVVVRGHAWNHPQGPFWLASLRVGRFPEKHVRVCGERSCMIGTTGRLVFSEPLLCDRVALSYGNAYGGRDTQAEQLFSHSVEDLAPYLPADQRDLLVKAASPFAYPRNPFGRGYVLLDDDEALARLRLPLLEDPRDILTPERLVLPEPWYWPLQPLPCSLDWLPHAAFPRLGWFGHTPDWNLDELGQILSKFPELAFGYADPEIFEIDRPLLKAFDRRALNGASLGQRFPYLNGDENIVLENLHARIPRWKIKLPGERPRLAIDDRRGGLTSLPARLYTVVIEPDLWRVTLTWCGFGKALRPYMFHELAEMPFMVEWG